MEPSFRIHFGILAWSWNTTICNYNVNFTSAWSKTFVLVTIPKDPSKSQKNWSAWNLWILQRLTLATHLFDRENCNDSTLLAKDCINHKSCKLNLKNNFSYSGNSTFEIVIVLPPIRRIFKHIKVPSNASMIHYRENIPQLAPKWCPSPHWIWRINIQETNFFL